MTRCSCLVFVAAVVVAAAVEDSCVSAGNSPTACADENAAVGLLQVGRKQGEDAHTANGRHREPMVNKTRVWVQLKASVKIERLRAAIQSAQDSATTKELQDKLTQLEKDFPSAKEIQQQFAAEWAEINQAVDVEDLQQHLDEAVKMGSAEVAQLKKQLEVLKERVPEGTSDRIRDKAAESWGYLQGKGVPLPDLDQITAQGMALGSQAMGTLAWAKDASSGAASQISGYASVAKDAVHNAAGHVFEWTR